MTEENQAAETDQPEGYDGSDEAPPPADSPAMPGGCPGRSPPSPTRRSAHPPWPIWTGTATTRSSWSQQTAPSPSSTPMVWSPKAPP